MKTGLIVSVVSTIAFMILTALIVPALLPPGSDMQAMGRVFGYIAAWVIAPVAFLIGVSLATQI